MAKNLKYAKEWLNKSWHHLSSAMLLYKAEHYTDIIAVELHYSVEITLKSFLAYDNKQIKKTHDLLEVSELIKEYLVIENLKILSLITKYHIEEAYPPRDRRMPSRDEIKEVLVFSEELFETVCNILKIDIKGVQV
jgi:HEPN domain-containing protein